jgi:hypothetical protein
MQQKVVEPNGSYEALTYSCDHYHTLVSHKIVLVNHGFGFNSATRSEEEVALSQRLIAGLIYVNSNPNIPTPKIRAHQDIPCCTRTC